MAHEPIKPREGHRMIRYIRYALIILGGIFLALLIFFVAQYESLRRTQLIDQRHFELSQLFARHAPLPVSEADVVVRSWMTFEYLNNIFALPQDYLQTQFHITDSHYPRITISSYGVSNVVDAIKNYKGT